MNKIVINLEPTPAPRARIARRKGAGGKTVAYYPKKYRDFKAELERQLDKLELPMLEGPVKLEVDFFMPIPKSTPKKKRAELEGNWHIKRPDSDNLLKAVKDGLNQRLYNDDSQVCWPIVRKIYSAEPRIEIKYTTLKDPNYLT